MITLTDSPGCPNSGCAPLRAADAADLLKSVLRAPIDEHVFRRFLAECQGNPLALLELPRMLTPEDLAGGFGTPDLTPAPGKIKDSFQRRAEALPAETRQLLLVAAAARQFESTDPGRARDIYLQALVAALRAGLLSADCRVTEVTEAMHAAPPSDIPGRAADQLIAGRAALVTEGYQAAARCSRRAFAAFLQEQASSYDELLWLRLAGQTAGSIWDDESWYLLSESLVRSARQTGALSLLPFALSNLGGSLVRSGELEQGRALTAEIRTSPRCWAPASRPM